MTPLDAARAAQRAYMAHAWVCEESQFCQEHRRLSLIVSAAYWKADMEARSESVK